MYLIEKQNNYDNINISLNKSNNTYIIYIKNENIHLNGIILNIDIKYYTEEDNYYQLYFDSRHLNSLLKIENSIKNILSNFNLVKNNSYIVVNKSNNINKMNDVMLYINSIIDTKGNYYPIVNII